MTDDSVTVVLVGAGYTKKDDGMGPLSVHSYEATFSNGKEFGKFVGNMIFEVESNTDIVVPSTSRPTWSVKRIEGASKELFEKWSESFSKIDMNEKDLSQEEILLYWLQFTQDKRVRKALFEL